MHLQKHLQNPFKVPSRLCLKCAPAPAIAHAPANDLQRCAGVQETRRAVAELRAQLGELEELREAQRLKLEGIAARTQQQAAEKVGLSFQILASKKT